MFEGSPEKQDKGKEKSGEKEPVFEPAPLTGLHGRQKDLARGREELAKRSKEFGEANKRTGEMLKGFSGEKRELLFSALDREFNPEDHRVDKKDKKAVERVKKEEEARAEFDAKIESEGARTGFRNAGRQAHLAALVYLHEEKLFEAEDRLNGTQEQKNRWEISVASAREAGEEKSDESRAEVETEDSAVAAKDFARQIAEGRKSVRYHTEALAEFRELADEEKAMAQIEDAAEERVVEKESIETKLA